MTSEGTIGPKEILDLLKRRATLILGVAALVTTAAAVVISLLPDIFEARSVIYIEPAPMPASYKRSGAMTPKLSQLLGILRQEVLSRDELRKVVNDLELYETKAPLADADLQAERELDPLHKRLWKRFFFTDPIERARRDVRIDMVKRFNEDFVEINVRARAADLAARAVNRIADVLGAKNREQRLKQEHESKAFIERELLRAQKRLQEAEEALARFRDGRRESLPENSVTLFDRISKLKTDTDERRERIVRAAGEIADLHSRITALVAGDFALDAQVERRQVELELRRSEVELEALKARGYGEGMPAMTRAKIQVERLRERLARVDREAAAGAGAARNVASTAVDSGRGGAAGRLDAERVREQLRAGSALPETYEKVQGLLSEIVTLYATFDSLERALEQNARELARLEQLKAALGETSLELQKLRVNFDQSFEEYTGLSNDLRDIDKVLAAEEAGHIDQFRTIEAAEAPILPAGPNRAAFMALALAGALGFGLGCGYLAEIRQKTYREAAQVEEDARVPVAAILPHVRDLHVLQAALHGSTNGSTNGNGAAHGGRLGQGRRASHGHEMPADVIFEEQLNRLRHAVQSRDGPGGRMRTILVTSAVDAEGKTLVATGLSVAFARSLDHWALLVETDLRRPAIAQRLGLPPSPGLAGHICEGVPLVDVIQPTATRKLSVICAGRRSSEAASLIASAQMRRVAEEVRDRYADRVIVIDAPPVLAAPDALSLSLLVDGIVVVVRAGKTSRHLVRQTLRALPAEKVIGIVLNFTHLGREQLRYYGSYYHGPHASPVAPTEAQVDRSADPRA